MLVSVFIPTYNASERLLNQTIESVLHQSHSEMELWLVDDASTDDTPERLDLWTKIDKRIKVIHKQHDGSVPYAWNAVMPHLNGEFTLYMSHDDVISPNCIEQMIKRQNETGACCVIPTCIGFLNNYLCPEEEFTAFNKRSQVENGKVINGIDAFFRMLDYSIPGFALWKTDLIRNMGMPIESYNSDECMQRIWVSKCKKVAFDDNAKFYYRMSPVSITKGLMPYHYASLLSLMRLLVEGRTLIEKEQVTDEMVNRLKSYESYSRKSYIYLATMFKCKRSLYNEGDSKKIEEILHTTKNVFFSRFASLLLPFIVNMNYVRKWKLDNKHF